MKRIATRRTFVLAAIACLTLPCLALPCPAFAQSRSITIDARKGMTGEIHKMYKDAVLGTGHKRTVSRKIIIHISGRLGFDAGYLIVPRHIRKLNTRIIIYVHHGNTISARICVNLLTLDRRQVFSINQKLTLR